MDLSQLVTGAGTTGHPVSLRAMALTEGGNSLASVL